MRLALLAATIGVIALAGMSSFAQAQNNNSCKGLCDCGSLQCTDFCSPSQCGSGACRRKFDAMVKACEKACNRCTNFSKSKKG
jgi:hypothetical protein